VRFVPHARRHYPFILACPALFPDGHRAYTDGPLERIFTLLMDPIVLCGPPDFRLG
jgi:hypothetical protein